MNNAGKINTGIKHGTDEWLFVDVMAYMLNLVYPPKK